MKKIDGINDQKSLADLMYQLRDGNSIGEMAMNCGLCGQDAGEGQWAKDDAEQHHQHGLLHRPK